MENLRSLEPQAKISHSYKKKSVVVQFLDSVYTTSNKIELKCFSYRDTKWKHLLFEIDEC